ncbi:MAG: hypothetical protein FWH57_12805 [Oscillospiraceae bacterium]|nr:hypothetical protein [Oscillospiraceae bacterium]
MKLSTRLSPKRILGSILLASVFVITGLVPVAAAKPYFGTFDLTITDNSISGSLSNGSRIDLSGIRVDVYDSVLDRVEPTTDGSIYGHNYITSVYTDKDGTVNLRKPSDLFLIMIDLGSLPDGVGIDKTQIFYGDAQKESDSLSISTIADFEVSYDPSVENGVRVDIFNSAGEPIQANYTVTPDVSNVRTKATLLDETYQISGFVTVNGTAKNYEFTVKNTGDPVQLVADALKAGQISKEDALDLYLEIWDSRSFGECGTYLLTQLVDLSEDTAFFNHLTADKQEALEAIVSEPNSRGWALYSGYGYFNVYYEDDVLYSGTPVVVAEIYDALMATWDLFVNPSKPNGLEFTRPETPGKSKMDVYVSLGNPWGSVFVTGSANGNTISFTIDGMFDLSVNFTTPQLDQARAVFAHEYFHAIQHLYTTNMGYLMDHYNWYVEGFASWASRRQYGATGNGNTEINDFLRAPNKSLPNNQQYGACILPLYIHANYGGDVTIKRIVERALYVNSSYTMDAAIDYAIKQWNVSKSFNQAFSWFWAENYIPQITYWQYASGMDNKPTTLNYTTLPGYPNGGAGVNFLACQFIDFYAPNPGDYLNITFNSLLGVTNMRWFLILKQTNGSVLFTDISSDSNPSTYSLTVPTNYSYTNGSIAAVNVGASLAVPFYLTIW